jgi:hypothetical protein
MFVLLDAQDGEGSSELHKLRGFKQRTEDAARSLPLQPVRSGDRPAAKEGRILRHFKKLITKSKHSFLFIRPTDSENCVADLNLVVLVERVHLTGLFVHFGPEICEGDEGAVRARLFVVAVLELPLGVLEALQVVGVENEPALLSTDRGLGDLDVAPLLPAQFVQVFIP